MKKKRIFPIILGFAVMCLAVWLFWPGILRWRQKTKAAEWMEIRLPSHETFVYMDDHGGFHGDGETVMILSFSPKAVKSLSISPRNTTFCTRPAEITLTQLKFNPASKA